MLDEQERRLSYVAAYCLCGFVMLSLILNDTAFQWKYEAPLAAKRKKYC